nr:site-specific DNA-methyltransferase [uncultured Allomuricauda sp.]
MDGTSLTPQQQKLNALREVLPEAFAEGKIDWEKLKAALGEDINFTNERYVLNWAGKSEAFKVLQAPTSSTLVPEKDESIKFDETENIFIEGENLEVLKVLQRSYFGKVKMIYIDPPYNTGNDSFIYPDKFAESKKDYAKRVGDKDEEGNMTKDAKFKKNSKENGQYHSNWMNMIYPRLFLAKNLLKNDGVIFVSIGEEEVSNLKLIMNEIFGEENFRNSFIIRRYDKNLNAQFIKKGLKTFNVGFEYVLCYSKSNEFSFNALYKESSSERKTKGYWKGFWNDADRPTMRYDILGFTPESGQWKWSQKVSDEAVKNYETYINEFSKKETLEEYWERTGKKLRFIRRNPNGKGKNLGVENWIAPSEGILRNSNWTDLLASKNEEIIKGLFDFPKNVEVIKELIKSSTDSDDIILDFFCGSGTTGHAVFELNEEEKSNRKFICIQLAEKTDEDSEAYSKGYKSIADISRLRLRKVAENMNSGADLGFKSFKLTDTNFKQWQQVKDKDAKALEEQMKLFVDPVKSSTIIQNMVYEFILKNGKSLNSKVQHKDGYFSINKDELILILEKASESIVGKVLNEKPRKVIALDKLFKGNDQLKTNTVLQFKDQKIELRTI